MLFIKTTFQLFLTLFLMNCNSSNQLANHENNDSHFHGAPKLELSMEKAQEEGYIVFKITNKGDEVFLTSPVASNHNRILLITDKGETIERYRSKKVKPTRIEPGKSKTWKINVAPVLEIYKSQDKKIVQLIWDVHGIKSSPFILNK